MQAQARKLAWYIEYKEKVARELREAIGPERARRAERDHHARRRPRHCGMTIHTGVGCSVGCVYCYIWDMGFPARPEPYPLDPLELTYALAVNPYVVPFKTMAAYGSVTEPFLPETRGRALEYIATVYRWLRLPSQVSTKMLLDDELVEELLRAEPRISVLVTVVALGEWSKKLEPRAPSGEERIEAAGRAARRGLSVALFVRPIIPGVTDRQAPEIMRLAREHGVRDVVPGTLRVTPGILRRLGAIGVRGLRERLPRMPRSGRDQVPIRARREKEIVVQEALRYGLRVHPSACSHNMYSHEMPCHACRLGPCYAEPAAPSEDEILEALEAMGARAMSVDVKPPMLVVRGVRGAKRDVVVEVLQALTKMMVRIV